MPHVGKLFPYLFPRDLYDRGFGWWGFAKRYKISTNGVWQGTKAVGWANHTMISDEGVWDYTTGEINWKFQPPPGADPLTFLRWRFELRHAEGFGDLFREFWFSGTRLARSQAPTNLWNARQPFLGGSLFGNINLAQFSRGDIQDLEAVRWAEMPP